MIIKKDTIYFKSEPKLYELEESGKKSNTLRLMNSDETDRFWEYRNIIKFITICEGNIKPVKKFTRTITNVCDVSFIFTKLFYGDTAYLFSWNSEEVW
uniref:Uncharacterized protein n=1 Tax=viral metagenome TaxID=1070528 RepID=A0A6M3M9K4_9ZZZZ